MKKIIKIFIILLIAAYFYIGYTSIINKHTHFYPNGIVITHSHPVEKNNNDEKPINQHDHSSTEICFFQCSFIDKVIIPTTITINNSLPKISSYYRPFIEAQILTPQTKKIPPRSPPA